MNNPISTPDKPCGIHSNHFLLLPPDHRATPVHRGSEDQQYGAMAANRAEEKQAIHRRTAVLEERYYDQCTTLYRRSPAKYQTLGGSVQTLGEMENHLQTGELEKRRIEVIHCTGSFVSTGDQ